jgi:hypothetical protein
MQDSTLRWGLGMGLVGAALGIGALLVGAFFFPIPPLSSADAVAVAILVRGVLALVALGVTMGLSYFAGLRVEQDRVRALSPGSKTDTTPQERSGSLIAGLLVAFCWWFGTTLTGYLLPLLPGQPANSNDFEQRVIWGILVALIGTGLGGLGSRTFTGRMVLDRVMVSPTATTIPLASTYSATATPGDSVQPSPSSLSDDEVAGELPEEPERPGNSLPAESLQ